MIANNPNQFLHMRGPIPSPPLPPPFVQILLPALTILYQALSLTPYPQLTLFTCLNAIYRGLGSYSVSAFPQIPLSAIKPIYQPLSMEAYPQYQLPVQMSFMGMGSYCVFISTFCSHPNPIPTYPGRGALFCLCLHICFLIKSKPNSCL